MSEDLLTRRKRLKFRAWHRGMQEADLILGRFVDAEFDILSLEDCDNLEALLEEADQDILFWLQDAAPVPEQYDTPVYRRLKQMQHVAKT